MNLAGSGELFAVVIPEMIARLRGQFARLVLRRSCELERGNRGGLAATMAPRRCPGLSIMPRVDGDTRLRQSVLPARSRVTRRRWMRPDVAPRTSLDHHP